MADVYGGNGMKKFGKFVTGPGHIFNDVPTNKEEALQHGNAMAASGNYPVGTSNCFNVGISGGCGPTCFVYLGGDCEESGEVIECLNPDGKDYESGWTLEQHYEIYPNDK